MNNYRLTVHLENVKKVRKETGKMIPGKKPVKETKEILYNTLSFYCSTKQECYQKLSDVRTEHTIAKGKDYRNKKKFDKELYNISWVN